MPTHPPGQSHIGPDADALVIFGITGDLAKKMTYDALYDLERHGTLQVPVIGVAIDDLSDEQLHARIRESVEASEKKIDEDVFKRLIGRISYLKGDYKDPQTFEALKAKLDGAKHPVVLPGDTAVALRGRRPRAQRLRAHRGRARGHREAVRA